MKVVLGAGAIGVVPRPLLWTGRFLVLCYSNGSALERRVAMKRRNGGGSTKETPVNSFLTL